MISIIQRVPCDGAFVVIFLKTMHNKKIIRFGFCDILNNQGLSSVLSASAFGCNDNTTSTLIIPDITKPHSIIVYNVKFGYQNNVNNNILDDFKMSPDKI